MILLQTTKSILKEVLLILILGNVAYAFSPKIVKTLIKTTSSLIFNMVLMLTKHSSTLVKVSKGTKKKSKETKVDEVEEMNKKSIRAPKKSYNVTDKKTTGKATKATSKKKQPKSNVIPFPDAK